MSLPAACASPARASADPAPLTSADVITAPGALPAKMKQIVAVAVAHVTQCPYCIKGHTKAALRAGATPQELMEAIWIASEMRAGAAYAHSALMLTTIAEEEARQSQKKQG